MSQSRRLFVVIREFIQLRSLRSLWRVLFVTKWRVLRIWIIMNKRSEELNDFKSKYIKKHNNA